MGSNQTRNNNMDSDIEQTVKHLVDSMIATKKVVVFSKSYCPYCTKAKKTLSKYSISSSDMEVLEIENRDDCKHIQDYLKQLTGASSVPRVFINGAFVGGGDDIVRLDQTGQLVKQLEDCDALTK